MLMLIVVFIHNALPKDNGTHNLTIACDVLMLRRVGFRNLIGFGDCGWSEI